VTVISEYPKNRMDGFSDGVMAIAITLLVIELGVATGSEEHLLRAILEEWPSYLAYVVSFFTIAAFWLRHTTITNLVRTVDSAFVRLNLLALFFIALLPYPTKLLAEYLETAHATRVAAVFYGIVLFLAALSFDLLWRYAARHRRLLEPDLSEDEVRALNDAVTPSLLTYAVGILFGLAFPYVAVALYLVAAVVIALPIGVLRHALRKA